MKDKLKMVRDRIKDVAVNNVIDVVNDATSYADAKVTRVATYAAADADVYDATESATYIATYIVSYYSTVE